MFRALRAAVAALVLVLAACGDDGGPDEGTPQDLSGTYTIVSFTQGGLSVPSASGTVTLTATTYTFSVTVPITDPPLVITDSGNYTAIGTPTSGTWTQTSSTNTASQATGTYVIDPATNRLTLDTTVAGVRNIIVLQKS